MTLLRAAARTLLASQFVVTGYKAVRNPEPFVAAAEPVAQSWLPVIQKYAPDQVASYIPTETRTLVRAVGGLELAGGLALASGKGRRLGAVLLAISLIPATAAEFPFWSREDPADKARDRSLFLKNVSLLGGLVLAARDTEGKPSLAWLAQTGTASLLKDTTKAGRRVAKGTSELTGRVTKNTSQLSDRVSKNTSHLTDAALTGGAALVGAAVKQSRKARKTALKQLEAAREAAEKQAKKQAKAAKANAKSAKVEDRLNAKQQKKDAVQAKLAAKAQKQAAALAKRSAKREKQSAKAERKQQKLVVAV
jgi:uncharacterized membrane protein YphA (DoxX/SURF4 family)